MLVFRDFHSLAVEAQEGHPLPFLKKDSLNFLADQAGSTLKVTIHATYSGYLLNRRVYPGRYLRQHDCYGDWCSKEHGGTSSFDKPILTHHDHHGEPVGRVVGAKFVQLVDDGALMQDFKSPVTDYEKGSGYIEVQGLVIDQDAITKILDGRYNTVSSGQSSPHMYCSICGSDFKGPVDEMCEHFPGRHYEDEDGRKRLCYIITGKLKYHELSYVNIPANANAVTVATQLNDSLSDELKAEHVAYDQALRYGGVALLDSEGKEIDLSNEGGEDLPATKTQIQVCSDIDLDELQKPAEVVLPDEGEALDDETFALGNMVRSLVDGGLLEDGPMSGMVSYFKAITDKNSGHQHILYLELDLGKRRIYGGTEYTSKGEHHYHSVDEPIQDLNAKVFKGETRDASQGDHHVHGFSVDLMEDREPQVALADALQAARLVDSALRNNKLTKHQFLSLNLIDGDQEVIDQLVKDEILDARLTAAQRKKLKASTFCGPNRSFPVPDCSHVTAARRLIGRAKLSSDAKARVLACVNRKAKAMGCGGGKDETDSHPYGMLFKQNEENHMDPKTETPPAEAKKTVRDELAALKDEALLDKAVELSEAVDSKDRQIVDLTGEKDGLKQKNDSLEASSKELTDENTSLREKLHKAKARELATMRLVTGALAVDSDEKFEEAVNELAERTEDSLEDAIKDARPAFEKALKEKTPNPSNFLEEKGAEKPPVDGNGDATNDEEGKEKVAKDAKPADPEKRKAEKAKEL